jgi:hypothetical protein
LNLAPRQASERHNCGNRPAYRVLITKRQDGPAALTFRSMADARVVVELPSEYATTTVPSSKHIAHERDDLASV